MRMYVGPRGTVREEMPTRPGNGTSRMWRRDIGGNAYMFNVVNMPSGEVRLFVSKYNGYGDDSPLGREDGMRFACAWTRVHAITIRPTRARWLCTANDPTVGSCTLLANDPHEDGWHLTMSGAYFRPVESMPAEPDDAPANVTGQDAAALDHMAALVEYVERAFASGERRVTVVVDSTAITVTHRVDRWVSGGREYRTIAGALGLNFPNDDAPAEAWGPPINPALPAWMTNDGIEHLSVERPGTRDVSRFPVRWGVLVEYWDDNEGAVPSVIGSFATSDEARAHRDELEESDRFDYVRGIIRLYASLADF